ncbi:18232_t:CDS:2, partial [Funneliformis geosporum]
MTTSKGQEKIGIYNNVQEMNEVHYHNRSSVTLRKILPPGYITAVNPPFRRSVNSPFLARKDLRVGPKSSVSSNPYNIN